MNYTNLIELLQARRTTRQFKTDEVSKRDIEKIIAAGMLGPSGFNSQPWEFVIVQDSELREAMVRIMVGGMQGKAPSEVKVNMESGFSAAPVFIIIYGDPKVRQYAPPHVKKDDDVFEFVMNVSLASAVQQMHLAATALGLGSMWVSAIRRDGVDEQVRRLLNIPDDLMLFELMAVGEPKQEPRPKKVRVIESAVHWNKVESTGFRSEEQIHEWFKKKE